MLTVGAGKKFAVVAVCVAIALSGCGLPAKSYDAEDLVGRWYSAARPQISITFSDEGTVRAEEWPSNIGCASVQAKDLQEAMSAGRLDLEGLWADDAAHNGPSFSVRFKSPDCAKGSFPVDLIEDSGNLSLCVYIPWGLGPDSFAGTDLIVFSKDRDDSSLKPDVCLT